jgi:hypothetical protein
MFGGEDGAAKTKKIRKALFTGSPTGAESCALVYGNVCHFSVAAIQ